MNSTRLPGKVMIKILDKPILGHIYQRMLNCKTLDDVCIATTENYKDDIIEEFAQSEKIKIYRGDEENISLRLLEAAKKFHADAIVRITGDCPLVDPKLIDKLVNKYKEKKSSDIVSNVIKRTYPDGLDIEVISTKFLKKISPEYNKSLKPFSEFLAEQSKKINYYSYEYSKNFAHHRWTIDHKEDLEFVEKIYLNLYPKKQNFTSEDIIKLLEKYPELLKINEKYCI